MGMSTTDYHARVGGLGERSDLHSSLLKKTMLNTEASNVAGRKMAPSSEMVFMDVLSRLLAWARRRWSAAIWRLSFDSFWAMMLYNCPPVSRVRNQPASPVPFAGGSGLTALRWIANLSSVVCA